jgi:hypothetical protein
MKGGKPRGRVGRPPKAKVDGRSLRKVKTALKAAKALLKQATLLRRLLKALAK